MLVRVSVARSMSESRDRARERAYWMFVRKASKRTPLFWWLPPYR